MDYGKIDGMLAEALHEEDSEDAPNLVVFIRTVSPPDTKQTEFLHKLGVQLPNSPRALFSGTLSRKSVEQLSDEPWVRRLSLSQKLRALD